MVEAASRVLAPHGSMVIELGDTYAGSGGHGGDYEEGGMREGQPKFDGSARQARVLPERRTTRPNGCDTHSQPAQIIVPRRPRREDPGQWTHSNAMWLAAMIDAEGAIVVGVDNRKATPHYSPFVTISMNSQAAVERAARITGVGHVTHKASGRVWSWSAVGQQARYVLLNLWPYLMIKQEQAKAVIELARHVEDYGASRAKSVSREAHEYRASIRRFVMNLNQKGGNEGRYPSDWIPPTPPQPPRHPLLRVDPWPEDKSVCLIPEIFRFSLVYGFNPLTGRSTPRWRARNVIRWCRPNPPVGALGDKVRPATSDLVVICQDRRRYFDLTAVRKPNERADERYVGRRRSHQGDMNRPDEGASPQNEAGAPPLDHWWVDEDSFDQDAWLIATQPYAGAHYATMAEAVCVTPIKAMCPQRVCRTCGRPSERIVETETSGVGFTRDRTQPRGRLASSSDELHSEQPRRTVGWTDCGHGDWRSGVVLDPFAGSGTTLQVATGHGRDAIGIDLDVRNADLALERVGPLFLTVEHHPRENPRKMS